MALRLRNELEWKSFLTNAGIPDTPSTLYAKTFVANRLNEQTVLQLTAEHLEKMDINVLGDQLAILQHIASLVAPTTDHTSHNSAAFKPPPASIKMPSIVSDMTNQQFRKFVIDWNVYKQMTGLPPHRLDLICTMPVITQYSTVSLIPTPHSLRWMSLPCLKSLRK